MIDPVQYQEWLNQNARKRFSPLVDVFPQPRKQQEDSTDQLVTSLLNGDLVNNSQAQGMQKATKGPSVLGDFFGSFGKSLLEIPKFGVDIGNKVGELTGVNKALGKYGLPGLGSMLTNTPSPWLYLIREGGKKLGVVDKQSPDWVTGLYESSANAVSDPNSVASMLGSATGAIVPMLAGTGALSTGAKALSGSVKGLNWLNKGINLGRLGEATVGGALSMGAMNSLQNAAVNWQEFDKPESDPYRMTGAEYLTRMAASFGAGAITAPFNPAYGKIANFAIDATTNAASSALVDVAAAAAANDTRKQLINESIGKNAFYQGLLGGAMGAGFRWLQNRGQQPPALPTADAGQAAAAQGGTIEAGLATPSVDPSGIQQKYNDLHAGVIRTLSSLTPDQLALQAKMVGADIATPQGIADKLIESAKATDPMNTGSGLEYVDGILQTNLYDKSTGRVAGTPVVEQAPVTPKTSMSPADAEAAQRELDYETEAIQQADQAEPPPSQYPLRELTDEELEYGVDLPEEMTRSSAGRTLPASSLTLDQLATMAREREATAQAAAPQQAEAIQPVQPVATQPETLTPPITGEENVQPRTQDNTNGEPGQPIITGEQPATPVEPAVIATETEGAQAQAGAQGNTGEVAKLIAAFENDKYATRKLAERLDIPGASPQEIMDYLLRDVDQASKSDDELKQILVREISRITTIDSPVSDLLNTYDDPLRNTYLDLRGMLDEEDGDIATKIVRNLGYDGLLGFAYGNKADKILGLLLDKIDKKGKSKLEVANELRRLLEEEYSKISREQESAAQQATIRSAEATSTPTQVFGNDAVFHGTSIDAATQILDSGELFPGTNIGSTDRNQSFFGHDVTLIYDKNDLPLVGKGYNSGEYIVSGEAQSTPKAIVLNVSEYFPRDQDAFIRKAVKALRKKTDLPFYASDIDEYGVASIRLLDEGPNTNKDIITGEPNATQEGQVPKSGESEYLGTAQGEAVPENIQEVRQEESGRPGDSNRAIGVTQEVEPPTVSKATPEQAEVTNAVAASRIEAKGLTPALQKVRGSVSRIVDAARAAHESGSKDIAPVMRELGVSVRDARELRPILENLFNAEPAHPIARDLVNLADTFIESREEVQRGERSSARQQVQDFVSGKALSVSSVDSQIADVNTPNAANSIARLLLDYARQNDTSGRFRYMLQDERALLSLLEEGKRGVKPVTFDITVPGSSKPVATITVARDKELGPNRYKMTVTQGLPLQDALTAVREDMVMKARSAEAEARYGGPIDAEIADEFASYEGGIGAEDMYSLPGAEAENAGASLQSKERSSERQLDYTERKRIKNKAARVIFEQLRGEESEGFWLDSNWRLERELGLGVDQATVDKINRFIDYNNLTDIVKADDVINYIDAKAKVRDANAEAGRIASDAQAEAAAQDRNIEQAQMDFGAEPASATPGYTMRKRKSKGPVAGEEQPGIGPESGLTTKSEVTPVAQTETASVNSPSQQASPRFQELQYEYDKLFPAGSGVMPLSEMVDFARDVIDKRSNEARQKGLKDNRSTRYQAIRGELLTKSIVQTTRQAEKISTALLDLFDDERLYPLADKILDASSKLPEDIRKNFDSIFTYHLGLRGTTNDLGTAQNPAPIRIGADIIWDYLVQTDPRAREFRDSSVQKYGERSSVEEVIDYVKNVLYPRPESAPMQYAAGVAIGPDTVHDPYDLKVFASPEDAGRSNANPIAKIWITPKSDGSNDINIKADYDLRKILTAAAGISIFSRGRWVTSEKYTYKSGRWVEKPTSAAGEGPEPSPSTKPGGPVGTQLSASLGFIPAVITADLDDDEEYFPGVTGRTLKQAALVFGAFATVRLGSKSGMFKLGSKVVPQSSPRAAMLNAADSLPPADVGSFGRLREKFPKFKDRVAAIRQHVDETARLLKLSKDEADAMFQQNLADERTLDGLPLVPGVTMLTTLGNLGRESSHPYPKQLNEAAYRGKASGQVLAIHAREARNVYESLDDPTKVKLGELIADIDYDTTKIINGDRDLDQGMRRVKGWQPQQNTTMDLRYYRSRVEDALGKTDAALLKAYRTIVEPLNKARAAYFDALAYEQTGEYIGPGMQKYSKMVMDSDKLMMDMQKGIQKMVQDGATQQEIDRAITALRGAQANYSTALRMRGILNELQLAQQQSVERQYIKRWLETPDAKMTVRIKQTATDPGTLQYFTESGQYADFMAEMNKPRSLSELGLTSRTHPVTGEVINSMKDLYIANGGTIDTRYGKASMQDLAKASVDPMIIRQALQNFIDAKSNGTIPGKQFAEFINLFGNDIRLLVDAKTLQDLNITNALGDKSKSAAGVSTNTIRQLINAIAVPRYVDPTKPRLNVLGYFPGKVDVVTKQANPNYDKQVINFMNGVIDHFEGTVLSKAEEGEIRRVANLQIADLVSRNVAPKYVSTVSQIVSGLSWKPRNDWADMKILGSVPDPVLRTLKTIDRGLALAGTFKMLGFNPTSAERNILQCYTNLASQLAAEGMSVTKTIGKAEAAYLRGMADKSSRASAVYEYLKTPASLRSIDDSLTDAMNGNAALAEVFRMAQASGAFEATFYRSLENEIGGFMAPGTKTRKVYEAAQLPQKVAEHHNRGISFIAGAMQALEARPNDIMGAYANGLRMQNMTQGNFASYNKTTLERMIADMPIGTSIMLLKSAAMRSTEQLLSHILVAATRVRGMETTVTPLAYGKRTLTTYKTNAKVFAPILATLATNLIFTGLAGSVVTGDAIVALEHLYNAFNKDDDELAAVNENFTDFYKSKGRAFADKMGIPTETYNFIWDSAHSGMMSAITGRNFGTDNDVTSLLFGDVPGFSIINDFSKVGGGDRDPATIARSINTQLGRVVKSVTQLAEGGKLGKGGYVVDKDYSAADALKDVALPSNLREAMYGVSKREDGGTIFFPDEAENYLSKLDRIDGLKLGGIHKDPFFAKVPGREKPQAQPNAVNRLRALIIGNYYDYSDAMETTLNKWEEIKDRPGVKQKLVDIAMKGQQGSRLSAAPDQFFKDAERRIRSYYLARAVQDSYLQLGLPAPAYKYANKDPMMPLVKFIAGKLRGGYKNIPDVQWEQSPYENYQGYQTPEYEAEQP